MCAASVALALRDLAPISGDLVKERLTGAVILVALIVVLVPELLRGPVRSGPPAASTAAEDPPLRSYTIELSDEAHAHASAEAQSAAPQPLPAAAAAPAPSPAATSTLPPAQATPAPQPAPPAAPSPAPKEKPHAQVSAPAEPAAASGAWLVQLGSFANHANAERLAQQLKSQGFTASVSQGAGSHLYRVRVGPASDRAAATQLQGKLKAAGHSGSVVPR